MTKKTAIFEGLDSLDKKSVQFLHKAIAENNLPGFDYLEFKQSLNGLKAMDMDDTMAIKSAFTTGSTVGLTKTKLVSSADHYKKILQTEKKQFDTALQNQMSQRVHGKKEEKATLSKKIEEYRAKISQLETQVVKVQEKLDRADEEIEAARVKIEDTRDKFESAFAEFIKQIDSDISNIKSVL
ncbi:MAG: hypothetical protein KTR24_03655 [Saprospiraceae bacterium]|nr:hypothetical protein [Saprospiraceae bacterium]